MGEIDQKFIDGLIATIEQAEAPASVTNGIVGGVLAFLNEKQKDLDSSVSTIEGAAQDCAALVSDIKKIIRRECTLNAVGRTLHKGCMPLYAKPYTYYLAKTGEPLKFRLPKTWASKIWTHSYQFSIPRTLQGHVVAACYAINPPEFSNDRFEFDLIFNSESRLIIHPMRHFSENWNPGILLVTDIKPRLDGLCDGEDFVVYYDSEGQLRYDMRTVFDKYPECPLDDHMLERMLKVKASDEKCWRKRGGTFRKSGFILYKKKRSGIKNGKRTELRDPLFIPDNHGHAYWGKVFVIGRKGVYRVQYQSRKGYKSQCAVLTVGNKKRSGRQVKKIIWPVIKKG